jgi:hypothetical protein
LRLSNDEAVQLVSNFMDITGKSEEFNQNLIQNIAQISKLKNVGYKKIFEDIKANSSLYAKYSGIGLENLIKANVISRQLGINFGDITKVLESFQDVESTIQKQMKLSIYLGSNIDLLTSASLQFHGKTDEAMKSLLGQLKMISDEQFNMPFIRGELSKQLGISEDKLVRFRRAALKGLDVFEDLAISNDLAKATDDLNDSINAIGFDKLKLAFSKNILKPFIDTFASETGVGKKLLDSII